MEAWRAAAALVLLAASLAPSVAAPVNEQTALETLEEGSNGCYYNFQHYGEGDRIMTNEPCLNCTCHNRMLMCYLRVCPFTKPIGQDCTVEKRGDQCCPVITCPDVPVDLLTSTSTSSPAEYGSTDVGHLEKYGCTIGEKFYSEGAKVPAIPNKPCELCYCIRNMTACVMQECTLHIDGCTPVYHRDVCCPVRYSCDHEDEVPMIDDFTTTVRPTPGFLLTTTVASGISQDCVHDAEVFADGALIKTDNACEHCYCMKGDIVCAVQECGTPMENEGKNCTALPPRLGQCCPDTYMCENDLEYGTTEADESAITIGHTEHELSTEKQDKLDDVVSSDHDLKAEDDQKLVTPFDEETTKIDEQSEVSVGDAFEGSGQNVPDDIDTTIMKTTVPPIDDEEKTTGTPSVFEESSTSRISDSDNTERNVIEDTELFTTPKQVKKSEDEHKSTSAVESIDSSVTETSTVSLSISDESTAQTITQSSEGVPMESDRETTEKQDTHQNTLVDGIEVVDPNLKSTTVAPTKLVTEIDSESDVSNKATEDLTPVTESIDDKKVITDTEQSTEKVERQGTLSPHHESENEIVDEYPEPAQILPHIPGEGNCLVDGVTYINDSLIPSENKCQKSCRCVSSIVKCEKIECSPPPKNIMNCEPMFDNSDSCCPTYVCDRVKETIPPESDSQISHVSTETYLSTEVVPHQTPLSEEKLGDVPSTETDKKYTPAVDQDVDHTVVEEYEKHTTPSIQYQPIPESSITDSPKKDTDLVSTTGEQIHEMTSETEIPTIKAPQEISPETIVPQEPTPVTDRAPGNEDGSDKLQPGTEKPIEQEPTTGYPVPHGEIDKHLSEEIPLVTESHTPNIEASSESQLPDSKTETPISELNESVTSITQIGEGQTHVTDSLHLITEKETQELTTQAQEPKLETEVVTPQDKIPDATETPIIQDFHDHTLRDEVQTEIGTIPGLVESDVSVTDAPQKYTPVTGYSPTDESSTGHVADTEGPKADTSIGETPGYDTGSPQDPSIPTVSSPQDTPTDQVTQTLDLQTDLPMASVSYVGVPEDESSTDDSLYLTPIDDITHAPALGPKGSPETQSPETERPVVLEPLATTFTPGKDSTSAFITHEQTSTTNEPDLHDTEVPKQTISPEQPISEEEIVTRTPPQYTSDGESLENTPSPTPHSEIPITSQGDISSYDVPKDDNTIAHSTSGYTSDEVTQGYTSVEVQTDTQKSQDMTPIVSYDGEAQTIGSDNLKPESHVTASYDSTVTDLPQKTSPVTESSLEHTLSGEDIQQHATEAEGYDSSVSSLPASESYHTDIPTSFTPVDQDQEEHDFVTKVPEDQTSITEVASEGSIPVQGNIPEKVNKSESSPTDLSEGTTPSMEDHTLGLDIIPGQAPTFDDTKISTPGTEIPKESTDVKDVSATEIIIDNTTPNVLDQVQTEASKPESDIESPHVTISHDDSKYYTQLPVDSETSALVDQLPGKEEVKTDSPYVTFGVDESSEIPQVHSTIVDDTRSSTEISISELSESITSSYTPTTPNTGKGAAEGNTPATGTHEETKDQLPTGEGTDIKLCSGDQPCTEDDKPLVEDHTSIVDTTDIKSCNGDEPCDEDDKPPVEEHTPTIDTTDIKLCNGDQSCAGNDKPSIEEHTSKVDITDIKSCSGNEPCAGSNKPSVEEHTVVIDATEIKSCNGDKPCAEDDKQSVEEHTIKVDTTDIKSCDGDEPCSGDDKPLVDEHTPKVDTTDIKSCNGDVPCAGDDKPSIEGDTPIVETTNVKLCNGNEPCAESEKPSVEEHTVSVDTTAIKSCNGDEPCVGEDTPTVEDHTTLVDTTGIKSCDGDEPCSGDDKPLIEEHTPKVDTTDIKSCDGDEPCSEDDKPLVDEHTPKIDTTDIKSCDGDKSCAEDDKLSVEEHTIKVDTTDIKSCDGDEPCSGDDKPLVDEHTPKVDTTDIKSCNGDKPCAEDDKLSVEEHTIKVDTTDIKSCDGDEPCSGDDKPLVDEHTPKVDTTDIKSCNGDEPCAGDDKPSIEGDTPIVETTNVKLCNGNEPCAESDKPSVEEHTVSVDTTAIKSCNGDEPCVGEDTPTVEDHTTLVDTTSIKFCDGDEPCSGDDKPLVEEHTPKVDTTDIKSCDGDESCIRDDKPSFEEEKPKVKPGDDKPPVEEHTTKVDTTDIKSCNGDEPCVGGDEASVEGHTPKVDSTEIKLCNGDEPCTGVDKPSVEEYKPIDTTEIKTCNGDEPCVEGDKPTVGEHTPIVGTTDINTCNGDQPCAGDNKPSVEEHTTKVDTTDIKSCDGDEPCSGGDKPLVDEHTPKVGTTDIKSCNGVDPCVESTPQSGDEPVVDDHTTAGITDVTESHDQEKEGVTAGGIVTEHQTLSSENLNERTTAPTVLQESSFADVDISEDDSSPTEGTKISDHEQTSTLADEKISPEDSVELTTTAGIIIGKQPSTTKVPQEAISETNVPQEETLVTLPEQSLDNVNSEEPTISPVSYSEKPEEQSPTTGVSEEVTPVYSGAHETPSAVTEISKTDETIPNVELPLQQTVEPEVAHKIPAGTEVPPKMDTTEVDNSQEQITDTKQTAEQTPVTDDKTEGPRTELPVTEIEQNQTPDDGHSLEYAPVTDGYQPDTVKTDRPEEEISKVPDFDISQKNKPGEKIETPDKENGMKDSVDEPQIPITKPGQETVPVNIPVNVDENEECKNDACVHTTDEVKPITSSPNVQEDTRGCEGANCDSSTQTNLSEEGSGSEPTREPATDLEDNHEPTPTDGIFVNVKPQDEDESTVADSEKTTLAPIVTEAYHKDTTELTGEEEHSRPIYSDNKTPLPTLPENIDSQQGGVEELTTPSILKSEETVTEKVLEIATTSLFDTTELENKVTQLGTKPEMSTASPTIDSDTESTTKINIIDESENEIVSIPASASEDITKDERKPVYVDIPVTTIKSDTITEINEIATTHDVALESSSPTRIPDKTVSEYIDDKKSENEVDKTSEENVPEISQTPSIPEYTANVDESESGFTAVQTESPTVSDHIFSVSVTEAEESTDKEPVDFTDHQTEQDVLVHLSTAMPSEERITTVTSADDVSESDIHKVDDKKPIDEGHITESDVEITPSPIDSKTTIAEVQSSQFNTDYSETTQYSVDKVTSSAVSQIIDDDNEYTKTSDVVSETHGVTTQYPKDIVDYESTAKSTTEEDIGLNVIETETDVPYKPSDENIPHISEIPEKPVEVYKPDDEHQHTNEKETTDSEVNQITTIGDDSFIGQTTPADIQKDLTTFSSIDLATSSPKIESDYTIIPTKDSSAPEYEPSTDVPVVASAETVVTELDEFDVTTRKTQTITLSSESQVTEYTPSKDEQSTLSPPKDEITDNFAPSLNENESLPNEIMRQPTTISTTHEVETSPVQNEDIPVHVSITSTDIPVHVDEHLTEKAQISTTDDSSLHVPKTTTVIPTEQSTIIDDLTSQDGSGEHVDHEKHETDEAGIIDASSKPVYKEEEIPLVTEGIQTETDESEFKLTTKGSISDDNVITSEDVATQKLPISGSLDLTTPQPQTDDVVTKRPTISTDNIETTVSLIDSEISEGPNQVTAQPEILPVTDTISTLDDDHKHGVDEDVSAVSTGEDSTTIASVMAGVTSSDNLPSFEGSSTTLLVSDDNVDSQTDVAVTDTERKPTISSITEKIITDKPIDEPETVTHLTDGITEGDEIKDAYTPISPTLAPSSVTNKEEIDVIATTNVAEIVNKQETASEKPFVPTVSYDIPENTDTSIVDDSLADTSSTAKETSTQHDELTKIPVQEEQLPSEATSQLPISDETTETDKLKDEDLGQVPETGPVTEVPIFIPSSTQPTESYDSPNTQNAHVDTDDTPHTISHEPSHKDEDATNAPTPQQPPSQEPLDFVPITAILGIPTTERNVADVSITDVTTGEEEDKTTAEDVGAITSHSGSVTQLYNEPEATEVPLPITRKPDVEKPLHEVEAPISKPEKPGKYGTSTSTAATVELPSPEHDLEHQAPGYGSDEDYDEDQAFGPGTCRYGGKVYVSAQQIPRDDPCDFCFCFRSDIICLQQSCPPPIHGCHEEPISGFCCPRYECPVSMATTLNITTTTTTTTTTLPPHFLPHAYKGAAARRGCQIKGHSYAVGEVVKASSGPCLHCTCGGDGQMKCDPKVCTPEPMLRQMIAAAVSTKRRR